MAITMNQKPRRRYRRRRGRGKLTMYKLARQINKVSRSLRELPETKELTTPWTTTVGASPLIYQMDGVTQGDSENQRSGLEISPMTLNFSLRIAGENPLTSGDSNVVRIIVFRWFDSDYPLPSDLLYDNTAGPFTGYPYIDIPTVWTKKPRFQVLKDTKLSLDENSYDNIFYKMKHKFRRNAKIHYSGPGSADIESKNIFYLIVSDSAVVPHPLFSGFSRLTYKDA